MPSKKAVWSGPGGLVVPGAGACAGDDGAGGGHFEETFGAAGCSEAAGAATAEGDAGVGGGDDEVVDEDGAGGERAARVRASGFVAEDGDGEGVGAVVFGGEEGGGVGDFEDGEDGSEDVGAGDGHGGGGLGDEDGGGLIEGGAGVGDGVDGCAVAFGLVEELVEAVCGGAVECDGGKEGEGVFELGEETVAMSGVKPRRKRRRGAMQVAEPLRRMPKQRASTRRGMAAEGRAMTASQPESSATQGVRESARVWRMARPVSMEPVKMTLAGATPLIAPWRACWPAAMDSSAMVRRSRGRPAS